MSDVVVAACSVAEIFDDPASAALFAEYERECANPALKRMTPQRGMYAALENSGVGQCFAARVDGALCGVAFLLMGPLPHNGETLATVESLFVSRAARITGVGAKVMKAVEAWAREAGCAVIFYSAPTGSRLARLLFLCGDEYKNTNHVFARRLA